MFKFIKNMFNKKEEPYVKIISEDFDEVNGIKLTLDWNDEFIKYLKSHGYQGTSDDAIMQKWLTDISKQAAENVNKMSISAYE